MVVVRDGAAGVPIRWESWGSWRTGRREPEVVWLREIVPAQEIDAEWCPTCWGNGRLFEMARNGEGAIPTGACPACDGTGVVPTVDAD